LVLDYTPLTIIIPIVKKHIQTKKHMIVKDSEEEKIFVNEVIKAIKDINTSNLSNVVSLENIVCSFIHSCHMQVHSSGKLHPHGDVTSKTYKSTFHGGYLSHNTSYGSAATLWVFCLPQQRYSYSTQSSMTVLLLSVSQH